MIPYLFSVKVGRRKPQHLLVMVDADDEVGNSVEWLKLAFEEGADIQVVGRFTALERGNVMFGGAYEIPKDLLKALRS